MIASVGVKTSVSLLIIVLLYTEIDAQIDSFGCQRGMYNCGTGICINASRLCDGINDCGDGDPGSDETEAVCIEPFLGIPRYGRVGLNASLLFPASVSVILDCQPYAMAQFGNNINESSFRWFREFSEIYDNFTIRDIFISENRQQLFIDRLIIASGSEDGTEAAYSCEVCSNPDPVRCVRGITSVRASDPPVLTCPEPDNKVDFCYILSIPLGCDVCVEFGDNATLASLLCHPSTTRGPVDCVITSPEGLNPDQLEDIDGFQVASPSMISMSGLLENPEGPAPLRILGTWTCTCNNSDGVTVATSRLGPCDDDFVGIHPRSGNILGGTPVVVTLKSSHIREDYDISCIFDQRVPGEYISDKEAYCISPPSAKPGHVQFTFKLSNGSGEIFRNKVFQSFIYRNLDDTVAIDVLTKDDGLLISNKDIVDIKWTKDLIPNRNPEDYTVAITMAWYDFSVIPEQVRQFTVKKELPNTGEARRFLFELPTKSSPFPQSESVIPIIFEVSAAVPRLGVVKQRSSLFYLKNPKSGKSFQQECQNWYSSQDEDEINEVFNSLPPCAPTENQARLPNTRLRRSRILRATESPRAYFRQYWNFFHSNNLTCYGANGLAHCCYDPSGNLKIGPPSGGHLHIEQEREFDRLRRDVIPYIYCCKDRQFDNCEKYYERRPSDDGSDFDPPPPAIVFGDPHLVTLDGHKYTFNGKGEYIIVETRDNSFTLQARMEEALDKDGSPAGATIFTAVVAKEEDSVAVQIQLLESQLVAVVNGEIYRSESEVFGNVAIQWKEPNIYSVQFSSGAYIEVSKNEDSNGQPFISTLIVSLPRTFKRKTGGLMGSFNDDQSDDLKPRHSDDPISLNSSMETIHNDFGITWIIRNAFESIFDYSIEEGTSWYTYFDPSFTPKFEIAFSTPEEKAMAEEVCKGDPFCLYDIATTSDVVVGMSTLNGSETLVEIINASHPATCNPPCVHGACVLTDTCSCQEGYHGDLCDQVVEAKAKETVTITRAVNVGSGFTIFWSVPSPDVKGFFITLFEVNEEDNSFTVVKEIKVDRLVRAFHVTSPKKGKRYQVELRTLVGDRYGPPATIMF